VLFQVVENFLGSVIRGPVDRVNPEFRIFGGSYGLSMPVKFLISPARAFL
jgi:hypothetical protein